MYHTRSVYSQRLPGATIVNPTTNMPSIPIQLFMPLQHSRVSIYFLDNSDYTQLLSI